MCFQGFEGSLRGLNLEDLLLRPPKEMRLIYVLKFFDLLLGNHHLLEECFLLETCFDHISKL